LSEKKLKSISFYGTFYGKGDYCRRKFPLRGDWEGN